MQRRRSIGLEGVRPKEVILHITLQQSLPRQAVDRPREFLARQGRDPLEAQSRIAAPGLDTVEEQHVPVNIEVQRAAQCC
ncbi:MAG: hypothetical protein AAF098_12225 [Pseudomonadota bacterium]